MLSKMRQYTSESQTARLIELGFEKPKSRIVKQRFDRSTSSWITIGEKGDYSIGELIEMLMAIKAVRLCIDNEYDHRSLIVKRLLDGKWDILYGNVGQELVDLLFDAILKLKEEGVI